MEPICAFAIFADEHSFHDKVMDLSGITTVERFTGRRPDRAITTAVERTLYVLVIADEGRHTLSISAGGRDAALVSQEIECRRENHYSFLTQMTGQFPILVDPSGEPTVNAFRLLLDGVPLANAYLVSVPEFGSG